MLQSKERGPGKSWCRDALWKEGKALHKYCSAPSEVLDRSCFESRLIGLSLQHVLEQSHRRILFFPSETLWQLTIQRGSAAPTVDSTVGRKLEKRAPSLCVLVCAPCSPGQHRKCSVCSASTCSRPLWCHSNEAGATPLLHSVQSTFWPSEAPAWCPAVVPHHRTAPCVTQDWPGIGRR